MDNADKIKADYEFKGYIINNIDFKLNSNFKKPQDKSEKIPVAMKLNIDAKIASNLQDGQVALTAIFNSEDFQSINAPFYLKVELLGNFRSNSEQTKEALQKFLNLNGVATLMPFFRACVADITRIANVPVILLPLININKSVALKKQPNKKN